MTPLLQLRVNLPTSAKPTLAIIYTRLVPVYTTNVIVQTLTVL